MAQQENCSLRCRYFARNATDLLSSMVATAQRRVCVKFGQTSFRRLLELEQASSGSLAACT